jgi:hypothetical protein
MESAVEEIRTIAVKIGRVAIFVGGSGDQGKLGKKVSIGKGIGGDRLEVVEMMGR